jgi:hypothetical protein
MKFDILIFQLMWVIQSQDIIKFLISYVAISLPVYFPDSAHDFSEPLFFSKNCKEFNCVHFFKFSFLSKKHTMVACAVNNFIYFLVRAVFDFLVVIIDILVRI